MRLSTRTRVGSLVAAEHISVAIAGTIGIPMYVLIAARVGDRQI